MKNGKKTKKKYKYYDFPISIENENKKLQKTLSSPPKIKKDIKQYCLKCGAELKSKKGKSGLCNRCIHSIQKKLPPIDVLIEEIKNSSYENIGKKYGVSGSAVRKQLKKYGKFQYRNEKNNWNNLSEIKTNV